MEDSAKNELARNWHPRLGETYILRDCLEEMEGFKLAQTDIPFVIRLVENPKYNWLFPGRVSLYAHDCIHSVLGRGLLPKDEAFVVGFTMGSTGKMTNFKEHLFLWITRWLYPEGYKFHKDEVKIFKMGMQIGELSLAKDLSKVDFKPLESLPVAAIREKLNIDTEILKECYRIEKDFFPDDLASKRLLDNY